MSGYKSVSFILTSGEFVHALFSNFVTHKECEKEILEEFRNFGDQECYEGFVKLGSGRLERLVFILAEIEGDLGDENNDIEDLFARIFKAGFDAGMRKGIVAGRRQEMDRKERMHHQ